MILAAFSSPSVSWLVLEASVLFAAGIGGVLVFWGLWKEGPPNGKPFRDIDDFRRHEHNAKRGWNLLMIGISVEIVVAVVFTGRDGWQARQTANEIAKNNPLRQPVASASAFISFHIIGYAVSTNEPVFGPMRAGPDKETCAVIDFGSRADLSSIGRWRIRLFADKFSRGHWESATSAGEFFHLEIPLQTFGQKYASPQTLWQTLGSVEEEVKKIESCRMTVFFLPPGTQVQYGGVTLALNSTRMDFDLLGQKVDDSGTITGWRIDHLMEEKIRKISDELSAPGVSEAQKSKLTQKLLEQYKMNYPGYWEKDAPTESNRPVAPK